MRVIRFILAGFLLTLMLVLVLQNYGLVDLRFLTWELASPIAIPVIGAYLLGTWTGRDLFAFLIRERKELRREGRRPL